MKKLSLLKLNDSKNLQPEELKRIKGGSCQSYTCQCYGAGQVTLNVDDQIEGYDRDGYL